MLRAVKSARSPTPLTSRPMLLVNQRRRPEWLRPRKTTLTARPVAPPRQLPPAFSGLFAHAAQVVDEMPDARAGGAATDVARVRIRVRVRVRSGPSVNAERQPRVTLDDGRGARALSRREWRSLTDGMLVLSAATRLGHMLWSRRPARWCRRRFG